MGACIGSKGSNIKEIMRLSGARIKVSLRRNAESDDNVLKVKSNPVEEEIVLGLKLNKLN